MNKLHIKGGLNQVKGRVKEEIGHATNDESLEGQGMIDRVKGKIQEGLGDLKDAVKHGIDSALSGKSEKNKS